MYSPVEAFTTCVGYSDFLSWSLLFNRPQFDNLVVLTTPQDLKTQEVCSFHHVQCYATEAFFAEGQTFGKSQAIDEFLKSNILSKSGWLVHFDSDIVLPPRSMNHIRKELIETDCIYGIDRVSAIGFDKWADYVSDPKVFYEQEVWLRLDRFPIMPRVYKDGYYVPIGFFQAWYAPNSENSYPTVHQNAARADMLFAMRWGGQKRKLIANAVGIHLESEHGNLGVNWNGRKTPPFKSRVIPEQGGESVLELWEQGGESVLGVWEQLEKALEEFKDIWFSNY